MVFEKVSKVTNKREQGREALRELVDNFLAAGIEAAIVKEYEEFYSRPRSLYTALGSEIAKNYKGKVIVTQREGDVYLKRVEDE